MNFIAVGTSHKYSPIELRERLSFPRKRLKDALSLLRECSAIEGAVILSTCNRIEIYASVEDAEEGIRKIEEFISRFHEIDKHRILPYLYIHEGKEALRHLFSVTCGLDSLILGETQVLGQVKQAYLEAENIGFIDDFLRETFNQTLDFAKMLRKQSAISEGKVSIGSVAVDFIKQRMGSLSHKNILIIGLGKVTELVLKYLQQEKPNVVFISNRTFEKAKQLASRIGARAVRFDALKLFLGQADVVITATSSPHFIIKPKTLEGIISQGLLIVDLALPRDVDPRIKDIPGIDLFCLEDLGAAIEINKHKRIQEAERVRMILDKEVERLWQRFTELEPEPVLLP